MQIQLTLKKCPKHSKMVDSMCLSSQCSQEILLCQSCTNPKHPHFNVTLNEFKTIFSQKIAEKRSKLQMVNYDQTPIESIGKNYKTEIDQDQIKIIEGIMKELKDDKRIISQELTKTSTMFAEKYSKQLKRVENIKLIKDYDPITLLLKLKMSSAHQVSCIRDAYLALNRMSDEELLILREEKAMKNKLVKYVKEKNLGNFVEKLKETIMIKKSQVKGYGANKGNGRSGSTERGLRKGAGMFDRRRSSNDELTPSRKPGIKC